ncbi:uncharacterized protein [Nicotiana tomentosiformis]|uniref:uncharacterized protein n=1 Tax=Nicotiana tomentosiformis TaxID=4098 RepID=UPI00388CD8BB
MIFKDIHEARKMINLYSLANGYDLQQVKSDTTRLRFFRGGVKFKTLEPEHTCEPAFENQRVDANTIAAYFQKGLQDNPKIKVKEMRASLKAAFNINVSESKCKRAKKMILEKLEGSFSDEYNKLVAYANELKLSNPGSDVIINLSKDALEEGKRRRWGSGEYRKFLWWVKWSTYEEDFKDQIKSMSQVDDDGKEVVEDLLKYLPKCWSRAFFDTVCKNQSVDNNLTESFNAWILQARHKPIIKMLEDIRIKVMNMVTEHEAEVMTWRNEYSPKTMELYNQFMRIALKCHFNGSADNGYEVTESSDRHIVNLRLKKCTCRAWDLCSIPCSHAICALLYKKVDPLSEIHWYLTNESYLLTYSHKLQPVRE